MSTASQGQDAKMAIDAPASPVECHLNSLHGAICAIENRLDRLGAMLRPVLQPYITDEDAPIPAESAAQYAPLVEELTACVEHVEALNTRLDDIIDRLAI